MNIFSSEPSHSPAPMMASCRNLRRLHELHGETELLVKVGHHELVLALDRLDGLHIGAGGAGLLQERSPNQDSPR